MPTEICSSCSNFCEQDTETLSKLKDLLPEGYQHLICKFCVTSGANDHFEATVRINLFSKDDVQKWKNSFQESSKVTLRIKRTHPSLSTKIMYKVMYRCQHSTQPRSSTADDRKGSKNTNCPATTCLTLYQTSIFDSDGFKRKSRSSDSHRADYPALVQIKHCHNHAIIAASAIKHRDVSETTKLRLEQLMLQGYAPSAALEMYKYDLQLEHGDDYVYISADRAVCPDRDYVYRLYYKLGKEKYGETRGESQIPQVKEFVEQLEIELAQREFCTSVNTATKKYVVMDITPDDQVVVSICTPLMHRVHKYLKHSSEMVFIDATGNLDRNHCRVFLLLTHSCAGGLPLGVIVTTSESRETIKHALHLLSNLVGSDGFGGRGRNGPAIFMTDDSRAERAAIHDVFPSSVLLLCIFHVLQAAWRYLWDAKNGISKTDRPELFFLIKKLIYASTEDDLNEKFYEALQHEKAKNYHTFLEYVNNLFHRRHEWAVCYRDDLPIRRNNTNNFAEAAMLVLKEKILNRTKAFNVQQLLDFIVHHMEAHYERKCIDISNNILSQVKQSRFLMSNFHSIENIVQIGDTIYEVSSSENIAETYVVNMTIGACTCKAGCTGGPCKHQASICQQLGLTSFNFIPEKSPEMQQLLCYIGSGKNHPLDWFQPLRIKDGCEVNRKEIGALREQHTSEQADQAAENECILDTEEAADIDNISHNEHITDKEQVYDSASLLVDIQDFHKLCEQKLAADPVTFGAGLKAFFMQTLHKIKTDTHLVSAFHTFGKYTGVSLPTGKRKIISNKRIGIQPTSLQRRQRAVPGLKRHGAGRPKKPSEGEIQACHEKGKSRNFSSLSGALLPTKRRKAPHSLKHCVSQNTSLGGTHSKK